ncbi:hypothetical protein AHAS_Ahas03G0325600 [Arachis hypogaea]
MFLLQIFASLRFAERGKNMKLNLAKENSISSHINSNNKKIIFQHDYTQMQHQNLLRAHITDDGGKIKFGDKSHLQDGTWINFNHKMVDNTLILII